MFFEEIGDRDVELRTWGRGLVFAVREGEY